MTDNPDGTTPPPCPWWCTELHDEDGWMTAGGELTKRCCRHVIGADDIDGQPVELELARFASVIDGQVLIDAPTVARDRPGASLGLDAARSIAETIMRLTEMADEPARETAAA